MLIALKIGSFVGGLTKLSEIFFVLELKQWLKYGEVDVAFYIIISAINHLWVFYTCVYVGVMWLLGTGGASWNKLYLEGDSCN